MHLAHPPPLAHQLAKDVTRGGGVERPTGNHGLGQRLEGQQLGSMKALTPAKQVAAIGDNIAVGPADHRKVPGGGLEFLLTAVPVAGGQTGRPFIGLAHDGVFHAEREEDILPEERGETLSGSSLDDGDEQYITGVRVVLPRSRLEFEIAQAGDKLQDWI